jgi:prepilin-type N-terminal cleavage/methylation domain-containing protein
MSSAATQLAFGSCSRGFCFPSAGWEHSPSAARHPLRRAFTLIELILVMAILTMAVSITAPALSNFFRGRTLDSEARRLLALTRGGQNRAVSEGIPIDLWVNSNEGIVGLDAEPSFETVDPKAMEFKLDSGVQIAVVTQPLVDTVPTSASRFQPLRTASANRVNLTHPAFPTIRFLPDGTVTETSPRKLRLTGRDGISLWVAQTQDKLTYEIQRTDK